MAGRDPEWPSDGGAERRQRVPAPVRRLRAPGGLVPGGAAAAEWLRSHRGGPHAPLANARPADTTRPAGTARPADTAQAGAGQPAATVHQAKAQAAEARAPALPLAGKVVVIDPGHNPNNPQHVAEIDSLVQAGGFLKACDTVGAETDAGYPEFDFTLDVARQARAILRAAGAKVILHAERPDRLRTLRRREGGNRQPGSCGCRAVHPRRRRTPGRIRFRDARPGTDPERRHR